MTANLGHQPAPHCDRTERGRRRRATITALVATLVSVFVATITLTSAPAFAQDVPAPGAAEDVATGQLPAPITTGNYVTTTTGPVKSLDVSAFSPTCIRDVPYISFTIVPKGFTSSGPATLTFSDVNGNFVEQVVSPTLSGQIIYPGAVAGPNGEGLDWPGWKRAEDGSWIPDPSDAVLRQGLNVVVSVDTTTATTSVGYVPNTSPCANPPGTTPPTTVPCVPGQNNDGTPDDDCTLSRTGAGVGNTLLIGGAALLAGLVFLAAARRRRADHGRPPAG
jgi:hypothetical protein